MSYAVVAGFVAGVLILVKYMMGRAKTDVILGQLENVAKKEDQDAYEKELLRQTKELEDAKIKYSSHRRDLDELLNQPSPVRDTDKGV